MDFCLKSRCNFAVFNIAHCQSTTDTKGVRSFAVRLIVLAQFND